ncbi:MAG: NAD(P)-dependent glycerol-3-phosphate dehydrogenase [Alphaproteobacteria bacterium]|nr:NAD(P)-dependent glycerol-3-phosphate dehydrogenase [Alphaproteobacteria bacterium]
MRCAVLGAGSWGTALALQLARTNDQVRLWDHRPDRAAEWDEARENRRYLPEVRFPDHLRVTGDLAHALDGVEVLLEVVPSQTVRAVMTDAAPMLPQGAAVCCASKGIETGSLMTMNEVLEEVLPERYHPSLTFLAGPSFAKEVARGLPTAVVVAGHHKAPADLVSQALHGGAMRAYYTTDVIGAELGGALKNIIAIACGVADGMGAGLNARAALITRGLAEITRLAVARGANPLTLSGLAGMGDLVLTCTGDLSRNRRVGLGLGQGKTLETILEELGQVAEGVVTAKSGRALALREGIEMPISEEIYQMLYQDKPVAAALMALMGRTRKAERDDERVG